MTRAAEQKPARPHRMSITLPAEHHEALARMAEQRKVSLAWIVRDAVERYLASETPLFDIERRNPH